MSLWLLSVVRNNFKDQEKVSLKRGWVGFGVGHAKQSFIFTLDFKSKSTDFPELPSTNQNSL